MCTLDPQLKNTHSPARYQPRRRSRTSRIVTATFSLAACFAILACTPTLEVRGYVPNETAISKLKKGYDTRRNVARLVGSPSSVSTFESKTWYYISKRSEHLAFFEEKVLDQQVVAIDFDDSGKISDIRRYKMDDSRKIVLVGRVTPTRGRELGLLEQLFGNIGRFTSDSEGSVSSPTDGR